MSDKEKLKQHLEYHCDDNSTFEDIILNYLYIHYKDFNAIRLRNLVDYINREHLYPVIQSLEETRFVAKQRAIYLKTYLSGDMWKTEEAARENLQPQIDNAQAIIDSCNNKRRMW